MARFISQDSVAAAATEIVNSAEARVDITGAWITGSALRLLLESVRPRIESGQVRLRMVCRLHGLTDLDITDLGAIKEFEQFGAEVRFSRRVHAKMVLVDGRHGVVSSSNLTSTAGYVQQPERQAWTNLEAGLVLEAADAELVQDANDFFERVWAESIPIDARAVGVVIGEPTTKECAAIRKPRGKRTTAAETTGKPQVIDSSPKPTTLDDHVRYAVTGAPLVNADTAQRWRMQTADLP